MERECLVPHVQDEGREQISDDDISSRSSDSGCGRRRATCNRFCGLFLTAARNLGCRKKKSKKRQQDVSLSYTPQNGLMVRMLGDVHGTSEEMPEVATLSVSRDSELERRPSQSALEGSSRSVFIPRTTSFSGAQDAEERLLSRAAGRPHITPTHPKFLTLHRRRRKRPITRGLAANSALLDDLYNGPTQCVLSRVTLWDFNAFALDSVCGGRPVAVLCVYLLHKYDLLKEFACDTVTIWKCFSLIEDGYHASNPYHNAIHAADVTQAMHCYLQEAEIDKHLTPLEKLAALIASVCHDLDHPGVNQPFLIATDNHLATLYNNASVLENHHWRCAMGCLWESGLLNNWTGEQVSCIQEMIRSLILATDITRQNEFLTKFKEYLDTGTMDMTDAECRHFSLQIALKCADICNPCRPWEVSVQWSHKICDEFYRQGDYERQLRLPVTALCDRFGNSIAKIQTGFIKFVVAPLFEAWDAWLHTELSGAMLTYLHHNLARWEDFLSEELSHTHTAKIEITSTEEEEEAALPHHSTSSTTSSVESHGSVLGSLENVSQSLHVRRRHSLPSTVPSLLPRTVIRRESLSEKGAPPIVSEVVRLGERGSMVYSSIRAEDAEDLLWPEGIGTADDNLFPEPSITAMSEMERMRKFANAKYLRRQSLPPLWGTGFVPTRVFPTPPIPQTPVQEEFPLWEKPSTSEVLKRTRSEEKRLADTGGNSGGKPEEGKSGCDTSVDNNGKGCESSDAGSKQKDMFSANVLSSKFSSTQPHPEIDVSKRVIAEQSMPRRASLDSASAKRENILNSDSEFVTPKCPRMENPSKWTRFEFQKGSDKENFSPCKSDRQSAILKTRLWRSLNQEDDGGYRGGIYKNISNQHYNKGRRGSAPLLKYEELRGGLRGGSENASDYLSRRRGSAPTNHLHLGSESMRLLSDDKLCRAPLLSRENFRPCDESVGAASISNSRSNSVTTDCKIDLLPQDLLRAKEHVDIGPRINRGGFAGGEFSLACPIWESNVALPMADVRRGSNGFELVSGLWRLRFERNRGASICSDESIGVSSSGGATPGTPSTVGPMYMHHVQPSVLPSPFCRRGSLPSDVYTSVDFRKWSTEAS